MISSIEELKRELNSREYEQIMFEVNNETMKMVFFTWSYEAAYHEEHNGELVISISSVFDQPLFDEMDFVIADHLGTGIEKGTVEDLDAVYYKVIDSGLTIYFMKED